MRSVFFVLLFALAAAPEAQDVRGIPSQLPVVQEASVTSENGVVADAATGEPITAQVVGTHENGAPRIRYTVVEGLVEGVWVEWYASGVPRYIGEWAGGKGVWTYFHETGAIRERSRVTADVWHGISEGWHPNGARAWSGRFEQGEKEGAWHTWRKDGAVEAIETYEGGTVVEIEVQIGM
ncbi:toxin-antitoxin system YwqK family antitoxin [Rubricoccus marinus]|uniref:Toxin-antitoxin system YwqK family antitoxin n=1 Tax=Rubricoccus marinus TaxID=716817 RepID=A0A259U3M0_9BACT|nr:hypothetical protein [Rubricoccus marinus]OZC04424.1 hypothetical protein BSZ36_16410 [Rubricoccus marinus]